MKKFIIAVEALLIVLLLLAAAMWGRSAGIWNGSTFYQRVSMEGDTLLYKGRDAAVNVTTDGTQLTLYTAEEQLPDEEGRTLALRYSVAENGSDRSVSLYRADGSCLLSATWHGMSRSWDSGLEIGHVISDYAYGSMGVSIGLCDRALCDMAIGNDVSRIAGQLTSSLLALLFVALGFALNFLQGAVTWLDRLFIRLFYDNAENLRAGELARLCLTLLSVALFVIGVILGKSVLMG